MIIIAKLYYRYGTMQSGKSLDIYKIYDNYKRQGKRVICFVPEIAGKTESRLGLETPSLLFNNNTDLTLMVRKSFPLDCILIEEAQFCSKDHVKQLVYVVDNWNVPVITYGLKNNFKNELFNGSYWLLVYADKIEEIKTVCQYCNNKATMVLRLKKGKPVYDGDEIEIKKSNYIPVCRKCWYKPKI